MGGMTVIHILMAPQYLNNNHVMYYVITYVGIRLGLRRTMVSLKYTARSMFLPVTSARPLYISKKKTEYYRDKLEHACNKTVFDLVKTLSDKQHQRQQPNFLKTDKGCDMFSEYFKNKTAKLVIDMHRQSGSLRHQFQETPLFTHTLNYFTETTDHDIVDIIRRTEKTCQLDTLPPNIIKPCIQCIAPVLNEHHARGYTPSQHACTTEACSRSTSFEEGNT